MIADTVLADLKNDREPCVVGGGDEGLGMLEKYDIESPDSPSGTRSRSEHIYRSHESHDGPYGRGAVRARTVGPCGSGRWDGAGPSHRRAARSNWELNDK